MTAEPLGVRPCIVHVGAQATARLAKLGLEDALLSAAVRHGDKERRKKKQSYFPCSYPGVVMWAESLGQLRKSLVAKRDGWETDSAGNYETVLCLKRRIAIAVVGGDHRVGVNSNDEPRLDRRRGPKTTERVETNYGHQVQLALDLDISLADRIPPPRRKSGTLEVDTWFLVLFPDVQEMRMELSLPTVIDKKSEVVARWAERILLPALPIAGGVAIDDSEPEPDDGEEQLVTRS